VKIKSKIFLLLLISSFLYISSIFSKSIKNPWESIKQETKQLKQKGQVEVDNDFIQTYQNKNGIWLQLYSYYHFINFQKKYGFTKKEFEKINNVKVNRYLKFNNNYYFLPFSKKYFQKLKKLNIVRQMIQSKNGKFIWPIKGVRITSRLGIRWGKFHSGIDVAAGIGKMVVAARDGIIQVSKNIGAYGITVEIKHAQQIKTIYAHLSHALVKKGDVVKKGQIIAFSGNTGRSTGPHLHFEVRCMNIILDPEAFLPPFEKTMNKLAIFQNNLKNKIKKN